MKRAITLFFAGLLTASAWAQVKETRRPPALPNAKSSPAVPQKQPTYNYFSILNGMPILLELHHDTVAGTGAPVDVYMYVIEMQIFNSDGNLEPVGLQIFNFFTAKAVDPNTAPNPRNALDCAKWNYIVTDEINYRDTPLHVWPYVEFLTAQGARTLQTNEDGQVFWADDIECWGAQDRFPPF